MNRAEFMRRLTELLGDVSPMERDEAIQYYNDYFDDAGTENEGSVLASLGTPEELARTIKAGLNDGGNGGEFTESGFSGYTQTHRDELARRDAVDRGENADSGANQFGSAKNNGGFRSGNNGYENRNDGFRGGNEGFGSDGSFHNGMGQRGNAGWSGNGGNSAFAGKQENPYGQATYNHYGRNDSPSGNAPGGQYGQPKQGMSGGMIAAVVILAILTSPIWIGLLGAVFGVVVALLAVLFGFFVTLLIMGVVFIGVAIALVIAGFGMLFSVPVGGLCVIGSGLIVFAIGLVFIWLMVLTAGIAIPAFVRGTVSLCRRLFNRGGARA